LDCRQAKKAAKRIEETAVSESAVTESAAESAVLDPTPPPVNSHDRLAAGGNAFEFSTDGAREKSSQPPGNEEILPPQTAGVLGQEQQPLNSRGKPEGRANV
jgi:hypothetical protein